MVSKAGNMRWVYNPDSFFHIHLIVLRLFVSSQLPGWEKINKTSKNEQLVLSVSAIICDSPSIWTLLFFIFSSKSSN